MQKLGKRILSMVLVLCMCFGMTSGLFTEATAAGNIVINGVDIGYAHGSFFTKNGGTCKDNNNYHKNGGAKATCHNRNGYDCAKTTDPSCNCMRYWPTGSASTCQIDLKASQCFGFARYCQWKVYGTYDANSPSKFVDLTGKITEGNCTGDTLKQKLLNCAPATHVRTLTTKKGWGHSVSIVSTSNSGVVFADCNNDGCCGIRCVSMSWNDFAKFLRGYGGVAYAKSYGSAPPAPPACKCSEQYAGTYICTTTQKPLTIRSDHSTNSAATGHSIPPGAEVTVTKASGTGKNDWAHVIYNGQSGYASMEYLKLKEDKPQQERDSRMALWFSNTEHGDGISSSRTGEQVYLCYKFYDANTGDMFDTYNPHSYKAILRIYQPDGSELGSWDFSDDRSWVRMVPKTPGTYKGELYFKFDIGGEKTITTNIEIKYEPRVTASYTELLFEIPSVESHTVTISYSGASMSKSVRVKCLSVDDCVKYEWGTWENHQMPLTITGVRAGDGEIEIGLFDGDTDELLATTKILVSVTAPTYTITYHVNGGSPTPEPQIKYHNVPLTLTDVIPHQKGHTFVGWSLVEGKNILLYKAGEIYTLDSNKDLDLYAYWKQGCEQDAHEWKPASCEAAKTCTICGQTDGQPLGHQWEKATCEKAETCKACGKTNGEPLGHNWVDATCEAAKTCSVCKKTEGEPVGHKWVEAGCNTAKTCSVCQKKDGEPLGHKYENGTCIRCGLSQCADNGHKWADATCEKPKTCSVCKKTEGEPLNHKWADATCEKAKTCSVCNKIEGDPLGHDWVAATCETAATCSRCGKIDGEPLGHSYVDGVCTRCKAEDPDHQKVARGDMNKDGQVNSDDALYLLRNSMNPDRYPIEQNGDVNGDGIANSDDAIYLLRHTMSPERYPLP